MDADFIVPDWDAPPNVHALITTRFGGCSSSPYARFNLGTHVGDDPANVAENRRRLRQHLPNEPHWLNQVHGTSCIDARLAPRGSTADAVFARDPHTVCAVLTADCLPILMCDDAGSVVAAAHAGWRGLAAGIIESTITAMNVPGSRIIAWLGPAIGPNHFEVGGEVRAAFIAHDPAAASAFVTTENETCDKWLCDIYQLAKQRLSAEGVCRISGAGFCTVSEAQRFYSYRREGVTGRMASLVWHT